MFPIKSEINDTIVVAIGRPFNHEITWVRVTTTPSPDLTAVLPVEYIGVSTT